VSHRCSFHLIDRIVYMKNFVILVSHTVYRLSSRELRSNKETGKYIYRRRIDFSNTNKVELIFRAARRPSPFCDQALFLRSRIWNVSQLCTDYSNYHQWTVIKRLTGEREIQRRLEGLFFPFRRHTSDINSRESVTEAICRARRTGRRQLWSVANS